MLIPNRLTDAVFFVMPKLTIITEGSVKFQLHSHKVGADSQSLLSWTTAVLEMLSQFEFISLQVCP